MTRRLLISLTVLSLAVPLTSHALASSPGLRDVSNLTGVVLDHGVQLRWSPAGGRPPVILRNGVVLARLDPTVTSYDDRTAGPASRLTYRVATEQPGGPPGSPVTLSTPDYLVGAATRDITPVGVVNIGGFGLADGSVLPGALVGRGGRDESKGERIKVRATVVDDGTTAVAIANIETQGYFAAYEDGKQGLSDMAAAVARDLPRLAVGNIVIASAHTHSGPDTIGAWGGPSAGYLDLVKAQAVAAIEQAYADRSLATLVSGHSDAADLIYNQSCTEGVNQSKTPTYPGPEVCATPGKDGLVRVLQATTPSGLHPLTYMVFAAHATAGGANGLSGDWPQFLSDRLSQTYGGVGLAMVGALGGTQPCRPSCSFTKASNPGYDVADRKTAIVANYAAHVTAALADAQPVTGPVRAAQGFIREPLVGPAVAALFAAGKHIGAELLRSHESPWMNGQTIRTVVGALRIGSVVLVATPGEGFPRIGQDVRDAVGTGAQEVFQLGLAGDQLGYLISPASYVPVIAAEVAVNDDIIFNVSPTIGDHVGCADITLVSRLGLPVSIPPGCTAYDVLDGAGDPIAAVPVGGIVLP